MTWNLHLPTVNAILNATSAVCVITGLVFIRRKQVGGHTMAMLAASVVSALFLVSYVSHHAQAGATRFEGTGWVRPLYFTILVSHTVLAVVIVPLVLRTLFLAVARRFAEHTRLARVTAPLWLYVSITGVIVYWMLYRL